MIGNGQLGINLVGKIHQHLNFRSLCRFFAFIILIPRICLGVLNTAPAGRILAVQVYALHVRLPAIKVRAISIILFQGFGQACG
ncbi:hypothetical protein D3C74_351030 [compost metagenome]